MKDSLRVGLENVLEVTVTEDMSPGHLATKVLSTPSMIGLMEQTCLLAVAPHLDENETTVGTHVCVSHQAAARAGEQVVIEGKLVEIDRRRLKFEVTARCGDRVLGEGTHQRAVIDTTRFSGGGQ
jgi:fluoroacetyl-CoA thioesterase